MEDAGYMIGRLPLFSLVFVRVGALLFSMPVFGARNLPVLIKVTLALAVAWALFPLVPLRAAVQPQHIAGWVGAVVREGLIGISMGWTVHLLLSAVPLAGQVIGFQMGFGIANVVDPLGQQQMSVIAQLLNLLALWLFLSLNGHHLVIAALYRSFGWFPVAAPGFGTGWTELVLEGGRHMFQSSLLLAAPMLLILIFISVALGISARTVPQMNVFFVGLPLKIWVGMLALTISLGFFTPWFVRALEWLQRVYVWIGRGA